MCRLLVPLLLLLARSEAHAEAPIDAPAAEEQAKEEAEEKGKLAWYVPDRAVLQFAGSIGFLSAGTGWSFLQERLDAEILLGWAPQAVAGDDFFTITTRLLFQPFLLEAGELRLRPLIVGGFASYTPKEDYWITPPDRYNSGYYEFSTAIRIGVILGVQVGLPVEEIGRLELYVHAVATEYRLVMLVRAPQTVGLGAATLAIGTRLRF